MSTEMKLKQKTIFITLSQVVELLTLSASTIRRIEVRDKSFPRRRQISIRRVGWPLDEINEWAAMRQSAE
ncbi:MAG: AlpA family phage regulatory protein [Desulfuromonadaceae bacterium]|nr:AlpA family phage regulatory protein [Desulfuromonadaceae bacterium]